MERDLCDESEQRLPVSGERRSLDLRILDIARGVDAAADLLRSRRQLHRGAAGGAADHHTMQKIRDARVVRRFEASTCPHEQRDGDDARCRILAHEHTEPVREQSACHPYLVGVRDGNAAQKHAREDEALHGGAGRNVTRT